MNKLLIAAGAVGASLVVLGIGMVSIPAALIVGGMFLLAAVVADAYLVGSDG